MGVHIANKQVADKIAEAARRLGCSKTAAVERALDQLLLGDQAPSVPTENHSLVEALDQLAQLPTIDERTPEEIIGYDENGLPT